MRRRLTGWHAHDDGTIHTHLAGGRRHTHPTAWDRWDAALTRLMGPPPPEVLAERDARRL